MELTLESRKTIDKFLVDLDGSKNKSRLGANSILAVSLACARLSAKYLNIPLFSYIGGINKEATDSNDEHC